MAASNFSFESPTLISLSQKCSLTYIILHDAKFMQSLFTLWQWTCQQEAPGGGLFSSITSSLFNLAALIVWNATMLWIQGHKNLHFQWYWLLSRISSSFTWSENCTLVFSSITLLNFWQKYWWFASWLASDPPEPTDFLRDLVQLEDAQLGGAQLAD